MQIYISFCCQRHGHVRGQRSVNLAKSSGRPGPARQLRPERSLGASSGSCALSAAAQFCCLRSARSSRVRAGAVDWFRDAAPRRCVRLARADCPVAQDERRGADAQSRRKTERAVRRGVSPVDSCLSVAPRRCTASGQCCLLRLTVPVPLVLHRQAGSRSCCSLLKHKETPRSVQMCHWSMRCGQCCVVRLTVTPNHTTLHYTAASLAGRCACIPVVTSRTFGA
jgi:hypothetical protein